MYRFLSACAIVTALAVSTSAQDTTIKSKTKVDADDAKVVTMTGCLQAGATGDVFTLTGAKATTGEDLEAKAKTEIDVDKNETEVKTKSRTEVEHEDDETPVGTAGAVTTYELMAKDGVNLTPHVGHRVEIVGSVVEGGKKGEEAEPSRGRISRGPTAQFAVTSVKMISPVCIQ